MLFGDVEHRHALWIKCIVTSPGDTGNDVTDNSLSPAGSWAARTARTRKLPVPPNVRFGYFRSACGTYLTSFCVGVNRLQSCQPLPAVDQRQRDHVVADQRPGVADEIVGHVAAVGRDPLAGNSRSLPATSASGTLS